jgi:hypothetical protein
MNWKEPTVSTSRDWVAQSRYAILLFVTYIYQLGGITLLTFRDVGFCHSMQWQGLQKGLENVITNRLSQGAAQTCKQDSKRKIVKGLFWHLSFCAPSDMNQYCYLQPLRPSTLAGMQDMRRWTNKFGTFNSELYIDTNLFKSLPRKMNMELWEKKKCRCSVSLPRIVLINDQWKPN